MMELAQKPIKAVVDAWAFAHQSWIDAARQPEGGNFDTPECLFWEAEKDRQERELMATKLASDDDLKAMMRFVWIESDADLPDEYTPQVRRWALQSVLEYVGINPVMKGA